MGKLFNLFSGSNNKNGKGISKEQAVYDKKLGFGFFFKLLKMRFGKLSASNLIFSLCNLPVFFALFGLAGFLDSTVSTASNPLYAQLYGIMQYESNPVVSALYGAIGTQTEMRVVSLASEILMYSALLLIFTFGLSTIGLVYNMRNVCKGESVYTWSDYFESIKKNFRQGFILGILDIVICALLVYDIVAYRANAGNGFVMLVFFYASVLFAAVYYIMRFYMYIQLVTCKMKLGKIIKNSFLLVPLGIKRNIAGFVGSLIFAVIFVYAFILLPSFTIILLFMFAIAFLTYIGVYCAYPVVDKYVIQPYYDDHPEERPPEPWQDTEQVFTDRE